MNTIYIKSDLNFDITCIDCFEWYLNGDSLVEIAQTNEFVDIHVFNVKTENIVYNQIEYMEIESYLTLRPRIESDNEYCPDVDQEILDDYIFKHGEEYELSLTIKHNDNIVSSSYSDLIKIRFVSPPYGGQCEIENFDEIVSGMIRYPADYILQPFNLNCWDWISNATSNTELSYNAFYENGVFLSKEFRSDAQDITGLILLDQVQLNILIKDELDTVTCYRYNAQFPSIHDILQSQEPDYDRSVFIDATEQILNVTNLGEHYDVAVSLYSIVDSIYPSDPTLAPGLNEEYIISLENSINMIVDN